MKSCSCFPFLFLLAVAVTGCRSAHPRSDTAASRDIEQRPSTPNADAFVQAAAEGKLEAVARALNEGIYPDVTNTHGFTALMWAAGQGRDEVVKLLLERRANVRAQARDGSEPLIFAAGYGKISTVQMLIAAGAD